MKPPVATTDTPSSRLPEARLSDLVALRVFRSMPKTALDRLDGRVFRVTVAAGETLLTLKQDSAPFEHFFFVHNGQVRIEGLDEEARITSINFLRKGEFFVSKSFAWRGQVATKAVAITNAGILVVSRRVLREVLDIHPPLGQDLRSVAERVDYRNRIYSQDLYARSVLDFLIDCELTQVQSAKVTRLDKCIECDLCYTSCQDRHGFQRLERGYVRFGTLDFAKSCITCAYPACIPACPVDSIVFNSSSGEIEILDNCIGCMACERACRYGAIRIHKADPVDPRFGRFFQSSKQIRPKFVADKCDHCAAYDDMACITSCPTGALLEIDAADLLDNPRIFGTAESGSKPLRGLTERSFFEINLLRVQVSAGVFLSAWLTFEAFALTRAPAMSFLQAAQNRGLIPDMWSLHFERGSPLCNLYGNLGFALVFLSLAYTMRKTFPRVFGRFGPQPAWLDAHNVAGAVGAVLIVLHTGFALPLGQPGTYAFAALAAVALSGLFGRFLYQLIPRGVAGTELRMRDIETEDAVLSRKLDALVGDSEEGREAVEKALKSLASPESDEGGMAVLLRTVLRSWAVLASHSLRLPRGIILHRRQAQLFLRLMRERIRLQRNVALLSLSSRFFIQWRRIHRPAAWILLAFTVIHIVQKLLFFPGW